MDTANIELSKELYELSRWEPDYWKRNVVGVRHYLYAKTKVENSDPAYTLGYILRKLPHQVVLSGTHYVGDHKQNRFWLEMEVPDVDGWNFFYSNGMEPAFYPLSADTPEDAAVKLAIALFNESILKR